MRRVIVLCVVLAGCGSGSSCGQLNNSSDLCDVPYGVGPDYTDLECGLGAICLPSAVAPCSGNSCCHAFCAGQICPSDSPCINLAPDQFPDGGVIAESSCSCTPAEADAGCDCDDAGCMWSSCLAVCSTAT
ncbi:MAG TPA: hypothetical protein VMB50_06645 [Myxococcales bacterium]|nr:hypothetical protein [Myxococcales bacterium]